MSQADYVGEFLDLHRKHKMGVLTDGEVERWRALRDHLNQAADPPPPENPDLDALEWDPDRDSM